MKAHLSWPRWAAVVVLSWLVVGCSSTPRQEMTDTERAMMEREQFEARQGSVFQSGYNMSLFLDRRARNVGDTITVTLLEKTDATKQSTTATTKGNSIDIPSVNILGKGFTRNGLPMDTLVESDQEFNGEGSSSQSNSLTGAITVVVTEVLPGGNLRVKGEKWLTINQGEEFIRVAGIVRPEDIGPDNSIPSFKLADARIAYSGKGALADANRMGWLGRLFQSVLSPF